MVERIFHAYLVLIFIVNINQPSGKNGISSKHDKEIAQRMKEHEVTLREHQVRLEKEIEDLEAREESLAWPLWELERKIQGHKCIVFCLLVPVVFMIWRQRRNGARGQHREEDTDLGLLGNMKGVAFLTKPFVLLRAVCISMGRSVGYLPLFANGLVELPLKLLRFH